MMSLLNGPALSLAHNALGQQVEMIRALGAENYMTLAGMLMKHAPEVLDLARSAIEVEREKAVAYARLCETAEQVLREGTGVVDITGDNVVSLSRLA